MKSRSKEIFYGIIIIFFTIIIFFIIYSWLAIAGYFKTEDSYGPVLMDYQYIMMDTCFDNTLNNDRALVVPNSNSFEFTIRLLNVEKSNVDIDKLKDSIKPEMFNYVMSDPQLEILRNHQATIKYNYMDKNQKPLFTIMFKPDKYN